MNHLVGTAANPHRVVLAVARNRGNRPVFSVTYDGQVIVEAADPEHSAARALLAMGLTGRLVTRWENSDHDALALDIERGAQLVTEERSATGLSLGKFSPPTATQPPDSVQTPPWVSKEAGVEIGQGVTSQN